MRIFSCASSARQAQTLRLRRSTTAVIARICEIVGSRVGVVKSVGVASAPFTRPRYAHGQVVFVDESLECKLSSWTLKEFIKSELHGVSDVEVGVNNPQADEVQGYFSGLFLGQSCQKRQEGMNLMQ